MDFTQDHGQARPPLLPQSPYSLPLLQRPCPLHTSPWLKPSLQDPDQHHPPADHSKFEESTDVSNVPKIGKGREQGHLELLPDARCQVPGARWLSWWPCQMRKLNPEKRCRDLSEDPQYVHTHLVWLQTVLLGKFCLHLLFVSFSCRVSALRFQDFFEKQPLLHHGYLPRKDQTLSPKTISVFKNSGPS